MSNNLTNDQKKQLSELEPKLREALKAVDYKEAEKITAEIQALLRPTGHETRLMQAKNILFETAMEASKLETAILGFIGVRKKVSKTSRLYLEATALLAICYLRKVDFSSAKPFMEEALLCEKNIKSDDSRAKFKLGLAKRFDDEALLASLAFQENSSPLTDIEMIQADAGNLVYSKNEDELYSLLGSSVSDYALGFISNVRETSLRCLTYEERKKLPPPSKERREIGKSVFSAVNRVIWRSLCDKKSDVYKMWFTNGFQAVLDKKYLTTAIVAALNEFKAGVYAIAVYVTALVIKLGIEVFCEIYKPQSLMSLRR
ncbi:hypothetical protein BJL95_05975 [Methylomonas sp. LWB]|uniref:hypothetical protein n=1 Tax=Methylomonas sp. LWB TaxID=1905845 RepID=UPI0008D94EB5|nr:hypothetical protein [Methylomonas sp. LWB]OHX34040.1 hypothetical protein BJL95_05975 [Methylomonas sp. LWB]